MREPLLRPSRWPASTGVALLAVLGVMTLAAPAGAATPAAPVIHETFTPLPCTGKPVNRTTLQLEGCGEQQVLRSDATINRLNAKIFAKLYSASARADLISGHSAWLAYRRSYCLSESDAYQGGTLAGVVNVDCWATVNRAHVKELTGFLAELNP